MQTCRNKKHECTNMQKHKQHSVLGAQDVCNSRCYSEFCGGMQCSKQRILKVCMLMPASIGSKERFSKENSREQVSCRKRKHAKYSQNAQRHRAKRSVYQTPGTETCLAKTRQAAYKRTHFQEMSMRRTSLSRPGLFNLSCSRDSQLVRILALPFTNVDLHDKVEMPVLGSVHTIEKSSPPRFFLTAGPKF